MPYQVEIEFAPAYELVTSLLSFGVDEYHRTLELGPDWARKAAEGFGAEARSSLPDEFKASLLLPLVYACPDRGAFLAWLKDLTPDQFHGLLAEITCESDDFRPYHRPVVQALTAWEAAYFRQVDPALLAALAADAQTIRSLIPVTPPDDLVELATGGVELAPSPGLQRVVLVPQFHFRPINLYMHLPGWSLFAYPAEVGKPEPGAPPLGLSRLTGALADSSRLRILRLLSHRPLTFTEIQKEMGLAKSTVHHHLVTLRVAGLIRVHDLREDGSRYSLRPASIDLLGARLGAYLREG